MGVEVYLLFCLVFIFIISFCGLLQKIRQSYERERIIAARFRAERLARQRSTQVENSDAYINRTFVEEFDSFSGVFPTAPPPPYAHIEQPPKYEDIVKTQPEITVRYDAAQERTVVNIPDPPPYTIST
ncbi:uncharacterized protein LOC114328720 [Diabrotica virgifera virgifera]|uniref:Uncharacterized protein n=1 Tax=Diabrotica virgifera virgifera TaxID=50390 RepID=A0ABM5KB28_DIAVI|nr:uncharacterized protein LOC114328720 [Diabrotica virgifera virgifera]